MSLLQTSAIMSITLMLLAALAFLATLAGALTKRLLDWVGAPEWCGNFVDIATSVAMIVISVLIIATVFMEVIS